MNSTTVVKSGGYAESDYDKCFVKWKNDLGYSYTDSSYSKMSSLRFRIEEITNPIIKGALIGTATGAVTGSIVGLVTAGPPGAAVGAANGAFAGFWIGFAGGLVYVLLPKFSKDFTKDKQIQKEAMEIVVKKYEDTHLEEFVCPLTLQPFKCPVRDKFGNLYEKEAIEEWIDKSKDKKGYAMDPKKNGMICKKDLKVDYFVSAKMQAIFISILKTESANENIHPDVKKGLEFSIQNFEKNISAYMEKETLNLLNQLRSKQITSVEYGKKLIELSTSLNINE